MYSVDNTYSVVSVAQTEDNLGIWVHSTIIWRVPQYLLKWFFLKQPCREVVLTTVSPIGHPRQRLYTWVPDVQSSSVCGTVTSTPNIVRGTKIYRFGFSVLLLLSSRTLLLRLISYTLDKQWSATWLGSSVTIHGETETVFPLYRWGPERSINMSKEDTWCLRPHWAQIHSSVCMSGPVPTVLAPCSSHRGLGGLSSPFVLLLFMALQSTYVCDQEHFIGSMKEFSVGWTKNGLRRFFSVKDQ